MAGAAGPSTGHPQVFDIGDSQNLTADGRLNVIYGLRPCRRPLFIPNMFSHNIYVWVSFSSSLRAASIVGNLISAGPFATRTVVVIVIIAPFQCKDFYT